MELRNFIKILIGYLKSSLILILALSIGIFALSFFLPAKYKATSLLFVKRERDLVSSNYFSYEGFYSAQTAEKYVDNVIALLKSGNISIETSGTLVQFGGVKFTERDFKLLDSSIVAKRAGPQLISLSVESTTPEKASVVFAVLSETLVDEVKRLNTNGDDKISVVMVSPATSLVTNVSPNPYLNALVAFLISSLVSVLVLSFKTYMKGK